MSKKPMTQQEFASLVDAEFKERTATITFPADKIPPGFFSYLIEALRTINRKDINATWEDMKSTYDLLEDYREKDVYTMGFAINAIETRSPDQLGIKRIDEYITLMNDMQRMATDWNEIAKPHKAAAENKVIALYKRGIDLVVPGGK
jgi:hypothetical protein